MKAIFECIANAPQGVIFNCSAGKDRSGVVSAVLLLFAGVKDEDIIENYLVTKYYIKQRLEYIKQNSDIDMAIVTPNKYFYGNVFEDVSRKIWRCIQLFSEYWNG